MAKAKKEGKKKKSNKSIKKTIKLITHNTLMLQKFYESMRIPS